MMVDRFATIMEAEIAALAGEGSRRPTLLRRFAAGQLECAVGLGWVVVRIARPPGGREWNGFRVQGLKSLATFVRPSGGKGVGGLLISVR